MPLAGRLPLVAEILAGIRALAEEGGRYRRIQPWALYAEGLTMTQLAAVFGVSRQRVAALLRDSRDERLE